MEDNPIQTSTVWQTCLNYAGNAAKLKPSCGLVCFHTAPSKQNFRVSGNVPESQQLTVGSVSPKPSTDKQKKNHDKDRLASLFL